MWFLVGYVIFTPKSVNGIGAIEKTKWVPPYNTDGKTNFLSTTNKSGCYLIKENNVVVYVGYSGYNLYKTLYRHFQEWNGQQHLVSYKNKLKSNNYKVRVILCTPTQALKLEKAYINKHKPRDNKNMIEDDYKIDLSTENLMYSVNNADDIAPF